MTQITNISLEEIKKIREQNISRAKDPKFREWYRRVFEIDVKPLARANSPK